MACGVRKLITTHLKRLISASHRRRSSIRESTTNCTRRRGRRRDERRRGRPPFTRDLNSPEQLIRAFHSHHHGSVGNKFVDIYNLRTIKDVHKISLFMHGALPAAPRFLHVERGGCETRTMVCLLLRCHRHRGRRRRFILFIIAHTECKQSRHFLRTQSNVAHCWMIGWSKDAGLWRSRNWAVRGETGYSTLQLHFFPDGAT